MGKLINALVSGVKAGSGQQELAQYHNNFNQFITSNPNSYSQGTDDASEMKVYDNGSAAWVNIAMNRKMLDVSNVEFFFTDKNGERIENKDVPDDILSPFNAGYAGMGINEMLARACGHEDLSGNALWLKDTNTNRYTQMAGLPGQFIPITPGMFKIELNSRGTAIEYFTITWKDGTQSQVTPDKVIQFKRNSLMSPFIGIGLISQMRSLVEFEAVATQYQINFLEKDGTPDMIFIDKQMNNPAIAKSKGDQLRAEYNARKYSNSLMYAYGEVDIKSFSVSSSDMQFIENRKLNSEQVISCMESTGTVLGLPDANNKASAGVLTNAYYSIVNSRVDHLVETINKQFVWTVRGNEKREISLCFTPYAVGDVDTVQKAVTNGLMTLAEGSKALGLPVDKSNEAAKVLYVGSGLRTLQYAFETKPVDFSGGNTGLSDDIEDTKKKPIIKDYE